MGQKELLEILSKHPEGVLQRDCMKIVNQICFKKLARDKIIMREEQYENGKYFFFLLFITDYGKELLKNHY